MAHGYRIIQHWNHWLSQHFLGHDLLQAEQTLISSLLQQHFGKYALLIGVPHQQDLLGSTMLPLQVATGPLVNHDLKFGYIESDFHELPILTGSVDLIILPHTLEFVDNPRQVLAEACRVIKPEGLIVLFGFNPYSMWGLKKWLTSEKTAPWTGHYIHANDIKSWLQLADFSLEQQKRFLFRPPVSNKLLYQKLHFLEHVGNVCFPALGGAYMLMARAKVIPLTPIRMKWKQQLSGFGLPTTISGHIARQDRHL